LPRGIKFPPAKVSAILSFIGRWADGFATENEFLRPHVEKSRMFSDRYRAGFHVPANITLPPADIPSFDFEGGFVKERVGSVGSADVKTSQHEDVQQGGRHRATAKREGINGI